MVWLLCLGLQKITQYYSADFEGFFHSAHWRALCLCQCFTRPHKNWPYVRCSKSAEFAFFFFAFTRIGCTLCVSRIQVKHLQHSLTIRHGTLGCIHLGLHPETFGCVITVAFAVWKNWCLASCCRGLRMFALAPQRFPSDRSGDTGRYDSAAPEDASHNPHTSGSRDFKCSITKK